MKKLFSVALIALMPSLSFAQEATQTEKPPVVVLRVVDNATTPAKLVEGTTLSVSKKQSLCVLLDNIPYQADNTLVHYFTSPKAAKFEAPSMDVKTSSDKKHFEITAKIKNTNPEMKTFHQCWKFDQNDPIGTYKLDVKMNDITFKGLSFKIVK